MNVQGLERMVKMYKQLALFILGIFLFSGCVSTTQPTVETKKEVKHAKVFEEEDKLIMFALRSEELSDFKSASEIYNILYDKSEKKEYLYRSLENSLYLKENDQVIEKVDAITRGSLENTQLVRLKLVALIQGAKYDDALQLALKLVESTKAENDYIIVSDIYTAKQEFDLAVKYLESAYLQDFSEKILDRMSIILYVNLKRQKDAIAQLETHTRIHGCSIEICKRLIAFYGNENNTKGYLSAYLRYYKLDPSEEAAKQITQLYLMEKEYNKLMFFLEESGSDDKTLLRLYLSNKNYTKAAPLAKKLYDESGEVKYLGESIIYEYESQSDKNKVFLESIGKKFEKLLALENNSLYLNYYGYILIDHDLDPKKGVKYVKKALLQEPNSMYYLDSLAWGYHKIGQCEKAMSTIQKVMKLEGGNDPEVLKHFNAIKQCKGEKQ